MTRLISIALICLMSFYASCPIAVAAEAGSYAGMVNQLMYATTGQLPSAEVTANFATALSAANAPTDLSGLAAAYSTNAAVKSLIDSIGTQPAAATGSTPNFVNAIYQNVFNHPASPAGLSFWSNAIDSGQVTKGNVIISILAGASTADMTIFTAKVTTAQSFTPPIDTTATITGYTGTTAADSARALLTSNKAAQEAADKAAADKAAQDAADKAAREAADKAAKDAEKAAKQNDGGGVVNAVKNFVHNHPVATVVITTVVVAAIVTAITVPICVHQNNVNKANNRNRALNNQAIVTRMIQLANPTPTPVSAVSTAVQAGGGYQPPI